MITRKLIGFIFLLSLGSALAQAQQETSVAQLIDYGDLLYLQNNCLTAIQAYSMALEREPGNVDAHLGRGRALLCEGAYGTAAEEFRQVITRDPRNMSGYVQLAQAYRHQYQASPRESSGRLDDAMAILADGERINNQYHQLYNMRGVIQELRGDLEGARASFEQAIQLATAQSAPGTDLFQYHLNAGVIYRGLGQADQALTAFRRAVTLNPSSASARNYFGTALMQQGRCEDAIFELQQAVSLSPSFVEANANLGIAQAECGNVAEAERQLRRALELDELSYPGVYIHLAKIYLGQGRYDDAIAMAARAAILPPNPAEAWFVLGQAYQARGGSNDAQNAQDAYTNALERDPNFVLAREALNSLP